MVLVLFFVIFLAAFMPVEEVSRRRLEDSRVAAEVAQRRGNTRGTSLNVLGQNNDISEIYFSAIFPSLPLNGFDLVRFGSSWT